VFTVAKLALLKSPPFQMLRQQNICHAHQQQHYVPKLHQGSQRRCAATLQIYDCIVAVTDAFVLSSCLSLFFLLTNHVAERYGLYSARHHNVLCAAMQPQAAAYLQVLKDDPEGQHTVAGD
jgi:hypothetical protein